MSRQLLKQMQLELMRRMQLGVFLCYMVAEVGASGLFYHLAPLNPICIWYPNVFVYQIEHLIGTALVILLIAIGWRFVGSLAYWESLCRSHERAKVLIWGGVWGAGIDLASSFINRTLSPRAGEVHYSTGNIGPWLVLRAGIWAAAYIATAIFLKMAMLPERRRMESSRARRD